MRVLWLTEHFHPGHGGMATSCERIVQGLADRGIDLTLVHYSARVAETAFSRERYGTRLVVALGPDPAHSLRVGWGSVARAHAREPYTHVVAFGGNIPVAGAPIYARLLGLPLITLLRGNDFELGLFNPLRRSALAESIDAAARVVTVSRTMEAELRALHPRAAVTTIPNGIDLSRWEALPSEHAAAQALRAAVEPGRQVIGLIGQLKAKKGTVLFLRALVDSRTASRAHLHLVGEVDAEVEAFLGEHSAAFPVTRVPPTDRYGLIAHYLACDWIAVPSYYDGLPNVVLEAFALGVPALASLAGGLADVIVDGENALSFAAGDRHACARMLVRALALPAAGRLALGRNAACHVAERFDAVHEVAAYEALLRSVPSGGAKAAVDPVLPVQPGPTALPPSALPPSAPPPSGPSPAGPQTAGPLPSAPPPAGPARRPPS